MTYVQSVDRALAILERLADEPKGLGITDIAKQLHLPKSTTHRLLLSLMNRNFVVQDEETGYYSLGMKVISLTSSLLDSLDIRRVARKPLEDLSQKSNEVVHLCVEHEGEVMYLDKVESREQTIRMHSKIGNRVMMHCTGVGKVLLTAKKRNEIEEILTLKGMPAFTEHTITELDVMHEHLQQVKKQGFAIDEIEHEHGIRCVAAPIFDYKGDVVAAISVAGPAERVTRERVECELAEQLRETARVISEKMGCKEPFKPSVTDVF
ncbi:IclR family transcriptional regulator [Desertibacillus haloalkaliphilus]|uniref:IclR family transcriptional regulator n=1 Tax=Desertibacillus haloalkaliphilus TaxID=1328930 RepID=UPI001C27F212|nr:IclR family transcriptional regulator [Desertibacillus haloalkaliphilus]MBU8908954.1 IclR family transcriptional regulator [Desertibacillus haloalkaliphilus]